MTESPNSGQLRQQAREATSESTQLAQRMSELPALIEEKRSQIRAARLQAARNGQDPNAAGADLKDELAALEAELQALPEQHFAARENAAMLSIQAESALISETLPQLEQAKAELAPLQQALAEARVAVDAKQAEATTLGSRIGTARERRGRQERLLERIEDEGPRPLAMFTNNA